MQSFHVSAAVKAVSMGDLDSLRFVEADLPEAEDSSHPPMFAFIARRTKGVKVYSLGHWLHTLTAVPTSTQPSAFRKAVKMSISFGAE